MNHNFTENITQTHCIHIWTHIITHLGWTNSKLPIEPHLGVSHRNITQTRCIHMWTWIITHFGWRNSELPIEPHLGLGVPVEPPAGRRRPRRGGSEKSLENGHHKEHRNENSSGYEPKRNGVYRVIEVPPMVVSLRGRWRNGRWPAPIVRFPHSLSPSLTSRIGENLSDSWGSLKL